MIYVVGLGPGEYEQMPIGVIRYLLGSHPVYLRTDQHPVVDQLVAEGMEYQSFDTVYEKHQDFIAVYEEIVTFLLEEAQTKDIVYATPGHPLLAEYAVQLLFQRSEAVTVVGGQSFLDPMFAALRFDPIEGFQLFDALSFDIALYQPQQHTIVAQVFDQLVASNLKLDLMEKLDDETQVTLVSGAGTKQEKLMQLPLYELDHYFTGVDNLMSVYIPAQNKD
ncbi:MAG: SAM-dependent methyltransferase [Culicoidibacterales bacterium]